MRADVEGELRMRAEPPLVVPIEDLAAPGSESESPAPLIEALLQSYRRTLGRYGHPLEEFRYVHAAPAKWSGRKRRDPLLHPLDGRVATKVIPSSSRSERNGVCS